MKGKDLIQTDKDKGSLLSELSKDTIESISDLGFWYMRNTNIITDRKGRVVKWCDARRSKLYMIWQIIKYKIFGKL